MDWNIFRDANLFPKHTKFNKVNMELKIKSVCDQLVSKFSSEKARDQSNFDIACSQTATHGSEMLAMSLMG